VRQIRLDLSLVVGINAGVLARVVDSLMDQVTLPVLATLEPRVRLRQGHFFNLAFVDLTLDAVRASDSAASHRLKQNQKCLVEIVLASPTLRGVVH
jgi:hypothetical protein